MSWIIHNTDCLNALLTHDLVDHIITDPPYDPKTHEGYTSAKDGISKVDLSFDPICPKAIVPQMLRVSRGWVIAFCSLEQLGKYDDASGESWVRSGVYRRLHPAPQFTGDRPGQSCEGVAIMHNPGKKSWNRGGHPAYWEAKMAPGEERIHKTQKPLALMLDILRDFTQPGETILDPFCGSGTTGAAAILTGRNFIGFEQDSEMCQKAIDRLTQVEQAHQQSRLSREIFEDIFGSYT